VNRSLDLTNDRGVSDSPEGVAFLTALLVRFREIGSARLFSGSERPVPLHRLRLDFYFHRQLAEDEWSDFERRLQLSWRVFFQLQRLEPTFHEVVRGQAPFHELPFLLDEDGWVEVSTLSVVRDLASLCLEELALLVSLVNEYFEDALALNEEAPQEDTDQHDEVIHRCLERVRALPGEAVLTGFRDDMRVLIYSSQEEY